MTRTEHLLRFVAKNQYGVGTKVIFNSLCLDDIGCLRVMLSNMCKRGLLYKDYIKNVCEHCFEEHACYRIADKGREYIARKDMRV